MNRKILALVVGVVLLSFVGSPFLSAQSLTTGNITGTVTDPSGAVTPNVTVTLKSSDTGETRTATTNSEGSYQFSLLRPGRYALSAEASGFAKAQQSVTVTVGQTSITDVRMALGTSSTTIEVTAATPLIQSDSADLSSHVDQNVISNGVNGGNDVTALAYTAPGVTMNEGQGYGNFSSNGLPATSNLFTVNGENDMDPYLNLNNSGATNLTLGTNELQEATVISSNAYSGQYGQQAGAQINYVTKSGTNQFHGNAIYEWTGSSMDANDWFNKPRASNGFTSTPRPFANNNEWAVSLGGPVIKDKLFFFIDYEGIRYIVPSSGPVYVPTADYITQTLANLTATAPAEVALYTKLFNLYTSAPGYNGTNFIEGSCGEALPLVNPVFTSGNNCFSTYQATPALPGTEWILPFRVDYAVSQRDQIYFRARIDHGTQATLADPFNSGLSAASYQPAYDGQFGWTHEFNSNLTNQFNADLSHYQALFTQTNPSVFPYSIISTGFNLGDASGITSYAFDFPQGREVTQYQFIDDLSWTRGRHSFKFGANFRRYDITDYTFSVLNNPEVLIGDVTGNSSVVVDDPNYSDGGVLDFYDGTALQTRQRFPSRSTQPVALWGLGLYAQDQWKVRSDLTLTVALRAEKNSNPVCQTNCSSLMTDPFNTLLDAGKLSKDTPYNSIINGHNHQIYRNTDAIDLGPRIGLAWTPLPKTVLRAGFGMFYDAFPAVVADQFLTNLPGLVEVRITGTPWGDTTTADSPYVQGAASAAAIQGGFDSGATYNTLKAELGSQFRTPAYHNQIGTFHTPYYEQWSLGVQQGLGSSTVVSVGYVGNHGVHIPIYNEGLNAFGFPSLPATAPTPIFTAVQEYSSVGISNYNGLTASVNQRSVHGLTFQASYTWSHGLDEVSNGGIGSTPYNASQTFGSLTYQINPNCLKCNNYGNADYDIRNSFSASYVWIMPFKFSSRLATEALGGWQISQNFFARSGLPLTVIDGNTSITNYGPTNTVANVIAGNGQQNCVNGNSQCLNPAAFAASNAFATFPNQRRNQFHGPGFFDSDFTIGKNFKLTEKVTFYFATNFYNIFNHPNFTNPDLNLADSTFGQITSTAAPPTGPYGAFFTGLPSGRIVQFSGKIIF
jgi:hypothetical protein